jgi:hypothetical protein
VLLIALSILTVVGCTVEPAGDAAGSVDTNLDSSSVRSIRVGLYDDTDKRPPADDIEVWMRGAGSWRPDMRFGGDVKVLGEVEVPTMVDLAFYPDGRAGTEMEVKLNATADMCTQPDGCAKWLLSIAVSDTEVEIQGLLVEGFSAKFARN